VETVIARAGAMAIALALSTAVFAQTPVYSPPRLLHAELPPEPSVRVVGGGEVLIELIVNAQGRAIRPSVVKSSPPFTQMVVSTLARWRFEPAQEVDEAGVARPVEVPIAVTALYRPPTMSGPSLGQPSTSRGMLSGDVAYPLSIVPPAYPPRAVLGAVVLFEVVLDEAGQMRDARAFGPLAGFEDAARDALVETRFRGATYRGAPVPSVTYVIFGFRPPVVSSMR
jgi:TonB family protein